MQPLRHVAECSLSLFRPVGPPHLDPAFTLFPDKPELPWIAAYLAVLDHRAPQVWLEVDLHLLATIGTHDRKHIVHRIILGSDSAGLVDPRLGTVVWR